MNQTTPFLQQEEPHRLSFCDLPLSSATPPPPPPPSSPDHLFEFSAAAPSHFDDIIFCGKIIHAGAAVKSQSLRKPDRPDDQVRRLSASSRFSGGGDTGYHAQRVNISALTSMSAKSRRRMFMFGPVKFKPEMELSAIKQRQWKMAEEKLASPPPKSRWGVVQSSLRGRSRLSSVLARSLGCIPVAAGGGLERWGL
ncbi:hypothetical protein SASPL_149224 [Salvia splendens]|uniref:Uncharacterized protein n=1 Tax=Salvia splendens TaxID=180675 RepID=A0A8X8Z514_SALSN|nr:hypothetical protein SASPL_149224 [Salvia splendens]